MARSKLHPFVLQGNHLKDDFNSHNRNCYQKNGKKVTKRKVDKVKNKEIAEKLNISQPSYQQWESGRRKPTLTTLEMFSDFFGVSIEELLSDGTVRIESILNADKISYKNKLLSDETVDLIKKTIKDIL